MNKINTTIRIRKTLRDKIKLWGKAGDTYDIIIKSLLERDYLPYGSAMQKLISRFYVYCQDCNKLRAMEVHHLDFNHNNNKLDNLLPLCLDCHLIRHNKRKKPFDIEEHLEWENSLKEGDTVEARFTENFKPYKAKATIIRFNKSDKKNRKEGLLFSSVAVKFDNKERIIPLCNPSNGKPRRWTINNGVFKIDY